MYLIDKRGKYTLNEVETYNLKYGIRHEKIISDRLEYSGVVERMNKTITDNVRCMLKMTNLPEPF